MFMFMPSPVATARHTTTTGTTTTGTTVGVVGGDVEDSPATAIARVTGALAGVQVSPLRASTLAAGAAPVPAWFDGRDQVDGDSGEGAGAGDGAGADAADTAVAVAGEGVEGAGAGGAKTGAIAATVTPAVGDAGAAVAHLGGAAGSAADRDGVQVEPAVTM